MHEFPPLPPVTDAGTPLMYSALPCSPTVPDRPPGRLRLLIAGLLRQLAARLARELLTQTSAARTPPRTCANM